MTFETFVKDYLYNNGMFEEDAKKVIELAKVDEVLADTMKNRWDDDIEGYPPFLKSVLIVSINAVAVKYIDANIPQAWFRPIFAG